MGIRQSSARTGRGSLGRGVSGEASHGARSRTGCDATVFVTDRRELAITGSVAELDNLVAAAGHRLQHRRNVVKYRPPLCKERPDHPGPCCILQNGRFHQSVNYHR